MKAKKSSKQIRREVDAFLRSSKLQHATKSVPGQGKQSALYQEGWNDANGSLRRRELLIDLSEQSEPGYLSVAIDMLRSGQIDEGMKMLHMTGALDADLTNSAIRYSELTVNEKLATYRDPKLEKAVTATFAKSSRGKAWKSGYVDRVLDTLEKKSGLRS